MLLPFVLAASASAGDLVVEDDFDLWYAGKTWREEVALPRVLERLEREPSSASVLAWVAFLAQSSDRPTGPATVAAVDAWAAGVPDVADVRAARAAARMLAAWPEGVFTSELHAPEAGPWCDDALALLRDLPPSTPDATYTALHLRAEIEEGCGRDDGPTSDAMEALALGGQVQPHRTAWYRWYDGVDPDEVALADAVLASTAPWKLVDLLPLVGPKAKGDGLDPLKARLREIGRAWVAEDRPPELHAGAQLLDAAGDDDAAERAWKRLHRLDPKNWQARGHAAPKGGGGHARDEEDPSTLIDPEARLAALEAQPPGSGASDWVVSQWWQARLDALAELGRDDARFEALRQGWRDVNGYEVNLEFAREAAKRGRYLAEAWRAADVAVDDYAVPWSDVLLGDPELVAGWREAWADALAARAAVAGARGDEDAAITDLQQAIGLHPDRVDLLVELAEAVADDPDWASDRRDLLTRALLDDRLDAPLRDAARLALARALTASVTWAPGGVDGWLEVARAERAPAPAAAAPAPLIELAPIPDLDVVVGGQTVKLSSLQGPVVLDLWATWCGPCKQALPHLDALARQYAGRVRVVALSVDAKAETADAYLAKQGKVAFETAWGGQAAWTALKLSGIPAFYVLDAEHRVVLRETGYGPGSREVDEALEKLVGKP